MSWDNLQPRLVALAAQELTAAEIGARLGVTKNAVIGRARRTGVKLRDNYSQAADRIDVVKKGRARSGVSTDDTFRVAAMAEAILKRSAPKTAARLKISREAIHRWRRDPRLLALAEALAKRVQKRLDAAAAAQAETEAQRTAALMTEALDTARCLMKGATPRDRSIVLRAIEGESYRSISESFSISAERVRQITDKWRLAGVKVPRLGELSERQVAQVKARGPIVKDAAFWARKVDQAVRDFPLQLEGV